MWFHLNSLRHKRRTTIQCVTKSIDLSLPCVLTPVHRSICFLSTRLHKNNTTYFHETWWRVWDGSVKNQLNVAAALDQGADPGFFFSSFSLTLQNLVFFNISTVLLWEELTELDEKSLTRSGNWISMSVWNVVQLDSRAWAEVHDLPRAIGGFYCDRWFVWHRFFRNINANSLIMK